MITRPGVGKIPAVALQPASAHAPKKQRRVTKTLKIEGAKCADNKERKQNERVQAYRVDETG